MTQQAELLEKVVATLRSLRDANFGDPVFTDRRAALEYIAKQTDKDLYGFAKLHNVLVDGSAADFACQFYTAFNEELWQRY